MVSVSSKLNLNLALRANLFVLFYMKEIVGAVNDMSASIVLMSGI